MTTHAMHAVPAQIIGCFDADFTACFVVLESDASRTMLHAFPLPHLYASIRLGQPVHVLLPEDEFSQPTVVAIVCKPASIHGSVKTVRFNGQHMRLLLEQPLRLRLGKAELVLHPDGDVEVPSIGVWASPDGTVHVPGYGTDTLH